MKTKKLLILLLATTIFETYSQAQITGTKIENDKYGFVDKYDNWVVLPQYYWAFWSKIQNIGCASISSKDNSYMLIDESGKTLTPAVFSDRYFCKYNDDLFGVSQKTEKNIFQGVFSVKKKRLIIPCEYSGLFLSDDNVFYLKKRVGSEELEGVCDINGNIIIPCEYSDLFLSGDNVFYLKKRVNSEKLEGVCDINGNIIIPCEYSEVNFFADEKYYRVAKNNLYGILDVKGKVVIPCVYDKIRSLWNGTGYVIKKNGFSGYASDKGKIIIPPKKYTDIYEINNQYLNVTYNELEGICRISDGKEILAPSKYRIVREGGEDTFMVIDAVTGKWGYYSNGKEIIPCEYDDANKFANGVAMVKKDGEVKLIKNPLKDEAQILVADGNGKLSGKKAKGPAVSRYPAPDSDVDSNIPENKRTNDNTFAVIIANENYPEAPVPYALNDGRMFREYCRHTLGIPDRNVEIYEDASYGNIITAVDKIRNIAEAYDGEASVIFYYAGHGFPDEKQSTAYLLPVDGSSSDIASTGYSLAKLYGELASFNLKSVVVFLDACFSGTKREDEMLAAARGVAITVKEETPDGNLVVFAAAQGNETAHQMEESHHGMFTYFLLKGLQQSNGDITLGDLTEYVTKQVKRNSVVINNKKQTPNVIPSESLMNKWQTIKLIGVQQ